LSYTAPHIGATNAGKKEERDGSKEKDGCQTECSTEISAEARKEDSATDAGGTDCGTGRRPLVRSCAHDRVNGRRPGEQDEEGSQALEREANTARQHVGAAAHSMKNSDLLHSLHVVHAGNFAQSGNDALQVL